jgi:hypothetical protein
VFSRLIRSKEMKKGTILAFVAIFVFSLSFSACDSFFGKSWGKFREYDLANINVNAGNIDEWVARSVGNPALAEAVNKKIDSTLKNQPFSASNAKLYAGRAKLAAQSVGLGASILSHASSAISDLMDEKLTEAQMTETLKKVVNGILNDFNANGGPAVAKELSDLLVKAMSTPTGVVAFNPEFIKNVEPADVADAIMLLVMAEIAGTTANVNSGNWDNIVANLECFSFSGGKVSVDGSKNPSNNQKVLAAYLNLLTDPAFITKANENPLTNALKDAILK